MNPRDRLYALLPEIYRIRDVGQGEPLRALLAVLESQFATIEADIDALYNNWFIETCDEWVVPYIGDLVGVGDLDVAQALPSSQRALVARTLRYRRWKGTIETLANVVRDATGWPAVAVEGFKRLAVTESVRHPEPIRPGFVDLRRLRDTGIDDPTEDLTAHLATFDDRGATDESQPIDRPGYNLLDLDLFVARLASYPDRRGTARRVGPGAYTFNPFGVDAPLFYDGQTRPASRPPRPAMLPVPLRPDALRDELHALSRGEIRDYLYLGSSPAFAVEYWDKDGAQRRVANDRFVIANLGDWNRPPTDARTVSTRVVVDPVRGRLAFPPEEDPERVEVSYTYGFSADLGGGVYDRWSSLSQPDDDVWYATVGEGPTRVDDRARRFRSLADALRAWWETGSAGLIRIVDSRSYALPADNPADAGYRIDLSGRRGLAIEAANEQCPCLVGNLVVTGDHPNARLLLNGLWLDGTITLGGTLALDLRHCSLRPFPNRPSLQSIEVFEPNLRVSIAWSILGAIQLSSSALGARVDDSIVDGAGGPAVHGPGGAHGPSCALERVTVLGTVKVVELVNAIDCLFRDHVDVHRRAVGHVRASFVPEGSRTPRRHRSQPDLALDGVISAARAALLQRLKPSFTSMTFGEPGYGQLSLACPDEIKTGSSLGSEVGAFHHLHQNDREARLRAVLDDFLPFGLRRRILYVT